MSATRSRRGAWVGAAVLVILTACATAGGPGPRRGASDLLTAEEMEPWGAQDLYTVIQRLRPRWLVTPKATNLAGPIPVSIVVDGARQPGGGIELLKGYLAGDVQEARFMKAADATTQYGTDMMSGAIVVTTRRGPVRD